MSEKTTTHERPYDPEKARKDARFFGKLLRGAAMRNLQLARRKIHVQVEDTVTLTGSGGYGCGRLPPNACQAVLHVESELSRTTVGRCIGYRQPRNGDWRGGIYVELSNVFFVGSVQCMYDGTYYVIPPEEVGWPPTRGWGRFYGDDAFSRCLACAREQVETFDLRALEACYLASCEPLRKSLAPIIQANRPQWTKRVANPWYWPHWFRRVTRLFGVG